MKTKDIEKIGKVKFKDKFNYSLLVEKDYNKSSDIKIICKDHGEINTTVYNHLRTKFGCKQCGVEHSRKSFKEIMERYIKKSNEKFNNRFKYLLYENKIDIECPEHGFMFNANIFNHYTSLTGCKLCGIVVQSKTNIKIPSKENLLTVLNKIHNNKYTYDLTNYRIKEDYITVICKDHGPYETSVRNIISNKAICKECSYENRTIKFKDFVERSIDIHGDNYIYYKYHYTKGNDVTKITHKLCNRSFWRKARKHLEGQYCPMCKYSKGESKVMDTLIKYKIEYNREYRLPNSNKPFDFYLPKLNILIEYDGEQHFKEIKSWGGAERLKKQIENDKIKDDLAKYNNKVLIRIHFKDFDIVEEVLMKNIYGIYPYRIGNSYYKELPKTNDATFK